MNPGVMKDRISVLELSANENIFSWQQGPTIWAKSEKINRNNIFSQVGIGAKTVKFTVRKCPITLHNALMWQGKHYFITDIVDIDRMYMEITTAIVKVYECSVERTGKPTLDELNRPVYSEAEQITFSGCLTEKYYRNEQREPMAVTEVSYILIVPKIIELGINEIVTISNVPYEVKTAYILDEYKNEYEIVTKGDV